VSIAAADYVGQLTAHWELPAGGTPSAPVLVSVTDDGSGQVTAAVTGDAGVTNELLYAAASASAWTVGTSRVGDGDIVQTGLTTNTFYDFIVVSMNGGNLSLPSQCLRLYVAASGIVHNYNILNIRNLDERNRTQEIICEEVPG